MDSNNNPLQFPINRRTAIKQFAIACGLALSAQSLASFAASFSQPIDQGRRKARLLNASQLSLVKALGELIIPTTDTPGAIAADVHTFIDFQLAHCFAKEDKQVILTGLKSLEQQAEARHQRAFLLCERNQQIILLTDMEAARQGFTKDDRYFFKQFKALVVAGYYTSEIGATQELVYAAVPGGYKAIKFATVGKAWALF